MSPRTSKQFEEIREESRAKIIEAALELFALKGYANTTISNIATKAKISKGLLYNYFGGKKDLLDAIIESALREGDDHFKEMMSKEDPKDKLKYILDLSFRFIEERSHFGKLMLSLTLQLDHFPEYLDIIYQRYKDQMPAFSGLLEILGIAEHEHEALALTAMLDGIGLQYMVLKDNYPFEEMKSFLYRKYGLI